MLQPSRLLLCVACAPLAACGAAQEEYPSLAIRDAERVSGTMEVAPAPPPLPTPASATLDQVEQLAAEAREAHAEFLAAAPAARSTAAAAAGAARGSANWSQAQVAIAELESRRSRAMIALADLDLLYVRVSTAAEDITGVANARTEVDAMVDEQNALIGSLLAELAR